MVTRFQEAVRFEEDVVFSKDLTEQFKRGAMEVESLKVFPINMLSWRKHDNIASGLSASASGDDLSLDAETFGTDTHNLRTDDVKASSGTRYARAMVSIPVEYAAGKDILIRINGGMKTTVADTTCNADVEAYKSNRDGTKTGSDLVSTTAQSINSLTFADVDFVLDGSGLSPGDILDVRVAIIYNDSATGTVVDGVIGAVELVCDIQG